MPTARDATAADFDRAAERWANNFWCWLLVAGLIHWLAGLWWPALPYAFAAFSFAQSCGASVMAHKLRKGSYPIPNPNNGVPDDAPLDDD